MSKQQALEALELSSSDGWRPCCVGIFLALAIGLLATAVRADQITGTSIVALVANPDKFDGITVRIIGFLRVEFEGTAIYLHQSDYEHAISKNALWAEIDPTRRDLDRKYVLLEGTFEADNHGHMGMFSGAITDVKRAQVWSDPEEPIGKQRGDF